MESPFTESDWKYMRSVKDEMLHALCERINQGAAEIIASEKGDPHERYLKLFEHVQDSNEVVADCFDDWSRSTLYLSVLMLRKHGLLTEEHIQNLSDSAREYLSRVVDMA